MRRKPPRLFTIGYEGRSVDEFVDLLIKNSIRRVIDVRELPLSRRRGFSKTSLAEALAVHDIEYVHLRKAGNPYRDQRADIETCLDLYRRHLKRTPDVLDLVEEAAEGRRSALLCFERDAACCHRSIIASALTSARSRPVRDL